MSETPKPHGPFVKWTNHGYDGWSFADYPSLREAIEADTYGSPSVICRIVEWEPAEKPEALIDLERRS